MNALLSGQQELALLDHAARTSNARRDSIRELLRDTALLVTSLSAGGTVADAHALRNHCRQLIERLSHALEQRGYPEDVRQEALVAQCGLLDETALRYLPTDSRAGWELKPLQVELFKLHEAGETVFDQLQTRMHERSPQFDLLECYAAILGMGFVGRYAREGEVKRTELIAALNARLDKLRPSTERPFVVQRAGRSLSGWFYRLSPWAIAGLAMIAAAIVWGACAAALDVQLTHLLPVNVVRP